MKLVIGNEDNKKRRRKVYPPLSGAFFIAKNCKLYNKFITAEIIQLATMGVITIKEIEKKILFYKSKDYELTHLETTEAEKDLSEPQKEIIEAIFHKENKIKISSLKNKFYKSLKKIEKKLFNYWKKKI